MYVNPTNLAIAFVKSTNKLELKKIVNNLENFCTSNNNFLKQNLNYTNKDVELFKVTLINIYNSLTDQ